MVLFQALTWEARDADDEYLISIFGRTVEGKSVCVTTPFKPYFFVKVPPRVSDGFLFQKIQDVKSNKRWCATITCSSSGSSSGSKCQLPHHNTHDLF